MQILEISSVCESGILVPGWKMPGSNELGQTDAQAAIAKPTAALEQ